MKTLFYSALAILIFFAVNAFAQDEHVAFFKNTSGDISLIRQDATITAAPGMEIMQTDTIRSGLDGSAGIIFKDGTMLSVGPSTEIDIERYTFQPKEKQYDFSLYMKKGTALFSTGKLGKLAPEAVKVNTPRAMVGARGTNFIVKVDK